MAGGLSFGPLVYTYMFGFHAGLAVRYDLLENLLTPLDELPHKDQFFDFLMRENDHKIPVSASAYHKVILRGFHAFARLVHLSCKYCTCDKIS